MSHATRRMRSRTPTALASLVALGIAAGANYQVQEGDTLSGIAARHGTSVDALANINGIADPDRILAGQRLRLADAAAADRIPTQAEVSDLIEEIAREHGWSPAFVRALAWQESGWNNTRISSAGAIGIMQVMPATGDFISRELVGYELDLHDPRDNVRAGVVFLQYLWELTDGDVERTLAGYYQGLRSVSQQGLYPSTERYIANVLALRDRFR